MSDEARRPRGDRALRDALRAAGGVAAVALAGCSAIPSGDAIDCETENFEEIEEAYDRLFVAEIERADLERTYRAAGFLLEQIRDGLPPEVVSDAEAVGEAGRESVVHLDLRDGGVSTGHATGWFVDEGVIATNAHNVQLGLATTEEIRGVTPDGQTFETSVLGFVDGLSPDVAVLGTDFTDAPPLPVRRDAELEGGQPLVQIGHPGGFGNWVIGAGRFAGRSEPSESFGPPSVEFTGIVTSIPGLKGVSGSPVLDLDGEVVATTTGGSDVDYREFADPVRVAPERVFDTPISPIMASEHVDVDVTLELVDRWT